MCERLHVKRVLEHSWPDECERALHLKGVIEEMKVLRRKLC